MITKKDIKGIMLIIVFFLCILLLKKQYQDFINTYNIKNMNKKLNTYIYS